MPSRAEDPFLPLYEFERKGGLVLCINALSGWGSISTETARFVGRCPIEGYQCPFGLKLHFYTDGYQPHYQGYVNVSMPFGLKLHFYAVGNEKIGYQNSTYQCPSG